MSVPLFSRPWIRPLEQKEQDACAPFKISVVTGGRDLSYAIPLIAALADKPVSIDVIGSRAFSVGRLSTLKNVQILALQEPNPAGTGVLTKIARLATTYSRLIAYAARTESRLFHILWLSQLELLDTLVLIPAFKLLGKTLVFTAHNVDTRERDERSSRLRRWTLRRLYGFMDHIFVHTDKMKLQLQSGFNVHAGKISVIPFGLNTLVADTAITREAARARLGIGPSEKVALFFGRIAPYKGLEYLIEAIHILKKDGCRDIRLLVAGEVKNKDAATYFQELGALIERLGLEPSISSHTNYIPDDDIEVYFKAADVCVLPYKAIFQTGVMFLAYRFGVPVVATDVGSMREDVVEARTGFVCRPQDPRDLADTLARCFGSSLYACPERTRRDIRAVANERYAWPPIATTTYDVYVSRCGANGASR